MSSETNVHSYRGGGSIAVKDPFVCAELAAIQPRTVVDFGAGAGRMGELCRRILGPDVHLTAVEACDSTVELLHTTGIYSEIEHALLQNWIADNMRRFDLAIFGDVLEHLDRREVFSVLNHVLDFAKHVIVTVPLRNLQQDGNLANPLEEHRAYLFEKNFDRRYLFREKHLLAPDPGYVVLNGWITGRRRWNPKGWVKDRFLAIFGRRGKQLLETFGYDAYPRAGT